MPYFDTHCHLDFSVFDEGRSALISECLEVGVDRFVIPGTRPELFQKQLEIAELHERVYIAFGIHPFFVGQRSIDDVKIVKQFLLANVSNPIVVAVGEIGLDKHCGVDMSLQLEIFNAQLELAESLSLPVILHSRKTDQLILERLADFPTVKGVVHGFTGSIEMARLYVGRGFKLGIGGAATWDNARKVKAMISQLSMENIVLETDSPDMLPQWLKGQGGVVNTPLSLPRIAQEVSELMSTSEEALMKASYCNSCELFAVDAG